MKGGGRAGRVQACHEVGKAAALRQRARGGRAAARAASSGPRTLAHRGGAAEGRGVCRGVAAAGQAEGRPSRRRQLEVGEGVRGAKGGMALGRRGSRPTLPARCLPPTWRETGCSPLRRLPGSRQTRCSRGCGTGEAGWGLWANTQDRAGPPPAAGRPPAQGASRGGRGRPALRRAARMFRGESTCPCPQSQRGARHAPADGSGVVRARVVLVVYPHIRPRHQAARAAGGDDLCLGRGAGREAGGTRLCGRLPLALVALARATHCGPDADCAVSQPRRAKTRARAIWNTTRRVPEAWPHLYPASDLINHLHVLPLCHRHLVLLLGLKFVEHRGVPGNDVAVVVAGRAGAAACGTGGARGGCRVSGWARQAALATLNGPHYVARALLIQ